MNVSLRILTDNKCHNDKDTRLSVDDYQNAEVSDSGNSL